MNDYLADETRAQIDAAYYDRRRKHREPLYKYTELGLLLMALMVLGAACVRLWSVGP